MNSSSYIKSLLVLCVLFFSGCVENLDFDQARDLEITPTLEGSLIYFEVVSDQVLERVIEELGFLDVPIEELPDDFEIPDDLVVEISDLVQIGVFNGTFFTDNLIEAEIFYELTNTTRASYTAQINYLSNTGDIIHSSSFSVSTGSEENPAVNTFTENFTGEELTNITNASSVFVNLIIENNAGVLEYRAGTIVFKSSGTFHFLVDAD